MNETALRWQARIGSLKPLAGLVLILAGIFFFISIGSFTTALKNPGEPETVSVKALVDGTVGANRYVSVAGFAFDDEAAYYEEENGRTVTSYYLLLDVEGYLVVVEAPTALLVGLPPHEATITGMTRRSPSDLKSLIESDVELYQSEGFLTDPAIYLAEDEKPPTTTGAFIGMAASGGIVVLCLLTFLFRSTVFAPRPIDPTAAIPAGQQIDPKASGRFFQLKQVQPTVEIGRRTRKFTNAVANIIPRGSGELMIYIHHIVKTKTYGITVSKRESDWGAFITISNVHSIEAGTLYGWKDRYAVRFKYRYQKDKLEELLVSFSHPGFQKDLVALLGKLGFSVM